MSAPARLIAEFFGLLKPYAGRIAIVLAALFGWWAAGRAVRPIMRSYEAQAAFANPAVYKLPFFPNGMFDLHLSAGKGHDSFIGALPYWILVALVVVSAYAQQKQTMRFQTQANPQMQMVGRIMPLFFAFISIRIPAGVVLYFFVSNLWQIGQQEVVYRKIGTPTGEPVGKKAKARHLEAKSREVGEQAALDPASDAGDGKPPSAGGGKQAPGGAAGSDQNRARKKRKKK